MIILQYPHYPSFNKTLLHKLHGGMMAIKQELGPRYGHRTKFWSGSDICKSLANSIKGSTCGCLPASYFSCAVH